MDEAYTLTREYTARVIVASGSLGGLGNLLSTREPDKVMLVYDSRVPPEHVEEARGSIESSGLSLEVLPVEGGEEVKTVEHLVGLLSHMSEAGLTRASILAVMGGGSLLDAGGFAAAVYMRGVGFTSIPSTLLAQADAGLGGKTGVNLEGKNIVGAFHPPFLTLVDPRLALGQDWDSFRQGFAEIVKHGLMEGGRLLSLVEVRWRELASRDLGALEEALALSAGVKMHIVSQDPWETRGLRLVLNLGHTVAHALERASGYRVAHGDAVSIGLVAESILSEELGVAEEPVSKRVEELLKPFGLPVRVDSVEASEVARWVGMDKKRRGSRLRIPLLARPGRIIVEEVDIGWLREWIAGRLKGSVLA